jgi:hypothetical protein
MFMLRRRSPWPHIPALCSGDEHGGEKWLTEPRGVGYAQKWATNLLQAIWWLLSDSESQESRRGETVGSSGPSSDRSSPRRRPRWQARRIISAQTESP